jgi:hypothetical protein
MGNSAKTDIAVYITELKIKTRTTYCSSKVVLLEPAKKRSPLLKMSMVKAEKYYCTRKHYFQLFLKACPSFLHEQCLLTIEIFKRHFTGTRW